MPVSNDAGLARILAELVGQRHDADLHHLKAVELANRQYAETVGLRADIRRLHERLGNGREPDTERDRHE